MGTNAELIEKFASGFRPAVGSDVESCPSSDSRAWPAPSEKTEVLFRSPLAGKKLRVEIFDGVRFDLGDIPAHARNPVMYDLKRLAMFKNPAFNMARRQGRTLPNEFHIAYEEDPDGGLFFPKGDLKKILDVFHRHKIPVDFIDKTTGGIPVGKEILVASGLTQRQEAVHSFLSGKRHGIMVGGGGEEEDKKITCHLIAFHGFRTVIVVKRKWQLHAWNKALLAHTNLTPDDIGMVGDGRSETNRIVTIGIDRSLYQHVDDFRPAVGFLVVDQCDFANVKIFYHLVWKIPARFLLGLASDKKRRDGLTGMMQLFMGGACGILPKPEGAPADPVTVMIGRMCGPAPTGDNFEEAMTAIFNDADRTMQIFGDVLSLVADGRRVLVTSPRISQLTEIEDLMVKNLREAAVVTGQTTDKALSDIRDRFAAGSLPVVLCTTKTLGGLDIAPADAVFVAGPFRSFETAGYLAQTIRPGGLIFEYADNHPSLNGMLTARLGFYRRLHFVIRSVLAT